MTVMDEKLLEALKLIREECKKYSNCRECPLHNTFAGPQCSLNKGINPEDWELYGDNVPPTTLFLR